MTVVLRLACDTLVLPVVPIAIGVAVAAITRSAPVRRIAATIALAAGIVVAHLVDVGVPHVPPLDTIGWIPIAVACSALGVLVDRRVAVRLALACAVTAVATRLIGRPVWTLAAALPWAVLAAVLAMAIAGSIELAARRMPPAAALLALAMTAASASFACLFGHSAMLAQLTGATAAVIGAAAIAALRVEPAATTASVAVVAVVAITIYARLYATLSLGAIVLLVASGSAPALVAALPLGRRARGAAAVVVAIVFGSLAAVAAR